MGKAAVIIAMGLVLAGTVYTTGSQRSARSVTAEVGNHYDGEIMGNVATGAFEAGRTRLARDFKNREGFSFTKKGTDVEVSYEDFTGENGKHYVRMRVDASHESGQEKHMSAVYRQTIELPKEVPEYQKFALGSGGEITMSGTADAYPQVNENTNNKLNANLHANSRLTLNGDTQVKGYGSYSGDIITGGKDASEFFDPVDKEEQRDDVNQSSPIEVPQKSSTKIEESVDKMSYFRKVTRRSGDVTLDQALADQVFDGSRRRVRVLYVDGSVEISGQVEIDGYGMLFSTGPVSFRTPCSAVVKGNSGEGDREESNFALYTSEGVTMTGRNGIEGQVFAGEEISMTGDSAIEGVASAKGELSLSGTPAITYQQASTALVGDPDRYTLNINRKSYNK